MPGSRWFSILRLRLRSWFHRADLERELNEELADHVEREAAARQASGLSPSAARTAALRSLGGLDQRKEECRDTWGVRAVEQLLQDLRYAARTLRRSPGFTAVAVLSLALGIGANTALFSYLNAVLLARLPVAHPEELLLLKWTTAGFPALYADDLEGDTMEERNGSTTGLVFSAADYEQIKQHNDVFSTTFAYASNDLPANVGLPGHAHDALVQGVSGNYFEGLGVRPQIGRVILPSDDGAAAAPVVVVSGPFWQRKLGGDPNIAGHTLTINGAVVTIVGVAPPEFFGLRPGSVPDLWVPLSFYVDRGVPHGLESFNDPRTWWLSIVGRLQPGRRPVDAVVQLGTRFAQGLHSANGKPAKATDPRPVLGVISAARGLEDLRKQFSTPLLLLMGMVGLVLIIACSNVASLLLTRATGRQPEIAVRVSLGARRLRIVRQLLTESVLLGLLGGAAGLLVAALLREALNALLASSRHPVVVAARLDPRTLLFTSVIALASGLLFGLAPALRAGRRNPGVETASRTTQRTASRTGKLLVAGQVGLSLVLLMGAGLYLRSLQHLLAVDLGFDQSHIIGFTVAPGLNGYSGERLAAYYRELKRRLALLPGVQAVGASLLGPVESGSSTGMVGIEGVTPADKQMHFYRHRVDPEYFAVLQLPARQGRLLGPQDLKQNPGAAVVNERLVRDLLPGVNPIGRVLSIGKNHQVEIVGVVRDARAGSIRQEPPPAIYLSYVGDPPFFLTFELRCSQDPRSLIGPIQRTALALDPGLAVVGLQTESELIAHALFLDRTFAILSSSFGFMALVLACVGLYGTMSYAVSRRRHEIGVRMALGAARGRIIASVLREALLLVGAGLAVGIPAAWMGSRLLQSQLFGLSHHDPMVLTLATVALVATTLLAGLLPARQASGVDPAVALRAE